MKEKLNKFIVFWLPIIAWAGIIFLLSSQPTGTASQIYWHDFIAKKSAHVFFYAGLSTLIYRALKQSGVNKKKAGLVAITVAIFYGATDEIHQSFIPGRMPRAYDVAFDTIGATLAIHTIWKYIPKLPVRLKRLAKRLELVNGKDLKKNEITGIKYE